MADAAKEQAIYQRFASDFLRPLVWGGTLSLDQPLSPAYLDTFAVSTPVETEVQLAIVDGIHNIATEIALTRFIPFPDRGTSALVMALYNILYLTDPMLDRALSRGARETIRGFVHELIDAAGAPESRGQSLSRHAVVSRILELQRRDVTIKNWAYTYRFLGREVPGNVTALPSIRLVKRQESAMPLAGMLRDADEGEDESNLDVLLSEVIRRSPITYLLNIDRYPRLELGGAVLATLSDDAIRAGIAHIITMRGDFGLYSRVGHAMLDLIDAEPHPSLFFYAVAFVLDLSLTRLFTSGGDAGALLAQDKGANFFEAVLVALVDHPDAFGPTLGLHQRDYDHVRAYTTSRRVELTDNYLNLARAMVGNSFLAHAESA